MTEPAEAEVQATANLSPVSPAPVHTATPLVVPALQDTVDTIDAMVAAAATLAEPNGVANDAPPVEPAVFGDTALGGDGPADVVDNDSFNDPYGDDTNNAAPEATVPPPQAEVVDNDDYAKTFDSPIEPEEGDGQDTEQDVSEQLAESNVVSASPSDHLTADHASEPVHDAVAHVPAGPAAQDSPAPTADEQAASLSGAQSDPAAGTFGLTQPSVGTQEQAGTSSVAPSDVPAQHDPTTSETQDPGVDIQQLMADLTSPPTAPSADAASVMPPAGGVEADQSASLAPLTPSTALPSSSTLPPRPPMPLPTPQSYGAQHQAHPSTPSGTAVPSVPSQPLSHATGPPGSSSDGPVGLPAPPAGAVSTPSFHAQAALGQPGDGRQEDDYQRQWDQFMADERQYMSEAKWDRFPEGSRIFIGNLSSDKVSKRDVFDVFHRFGRLAQISLKSAYGFVQYHTVDEGHQAMEHLQGIEIKGRRIHLEISRAQEKSKKERNRSPDRGRGRRGDKRNQNRDDYRPGRNQSPRRGDYHAREEGYGRDAGSYESGRGGRGRSRSPGYVRNDRDSYRRRSPSPYGRSRREPELDLPRRYGADVPDVQIIMQPDVSRDFATWVEGGFRAKGLKTEVMYLHPRFPKDQVIQRQAAEGVHGVVDLDMRAQSLGRIPVQAFDRSGGGNNIRFDQYVDLDPGTAAEVIARAKSSAAPSYGQAYGAPPGYGNPNPYAPPHQHPAHGGGYPAPQHASPYPPQQPGQPGAPDIASLVGQVDNATLQRLLSSMQGGQGPAPGAPAGYGVNPPGPPANQQVDIQAILGSLGGQASAQSAPPQGQYGAAYGTPAPGAHNGASANDPAAQAQVQNIMAQLARYRQ
ncbi:nuclear polyadenylated RNA-binding protein 3 [Purpureocillium takamizusanense]|uniref:Nuclear polyadenylated RNA-binding protein 3 n=1 Tax=Purpureocillium takamizusanense TaxID=2060973 RepID=A0A9Q8QEC0_9HYPO|nr:nuclear polyadenylated RNA-binding protein 3 [Purpureocillium takamizusanense]UNI17651.1 nuclear polyadenylated RNA-binding protein 3 [Purpureocillium takamizusanense]